MGRAERFLNAGGAAGIQWKRLKGCDQGSGTAVAPVDPSGFVTSGGHNTLTGITKYKLSNVAVAADGYQENVARNTVDVAAVLPGFNADRQAIAIKITRGPTPSGTAEVNIFAGLASGTHPTWLGVFGFVGHGSDSADNAGTQGTATLSFSGTGGIVDECVMILTFSRTGSGWETRITGRCRLQNGTYNPAANWGSGQVLAGDPALAKFVWGVGHRSTDPMSQMAHFLVEVGTIDFPDDLADEGPPREAKPATGPGSKAVLVGAGDSYLVGQGEGTASGAFPPNVRVWSNGTEIFAYPNTSPVPQTGHLKAIIDALKAAGYDEIKVFLRGAAATERSDTLGRFVRQAINDAHFNDEEVDIVYLTSVSTNDCQSEAEVTELLYQLDRTYKYIDTFCPRARTLHLMSSVVQPGPSSNHPFIDSARAGIRTLCSKPHRAAIEGDPSYRGVDNVHLLATGYNAQGADAAAAYLGME